MTGYYHQFYVQTAMILTNGRRGKTLGYVDPDVEALAQLMIRLAGIIVWALQNCKDYQTTVETGEVAWSKLRGED